MTRHAPSHLTFDEFDALLTGAANPAAAAHVAHCAECAANLAAQRDIVARLDALPFFSPSADFADLVMRQVSVPDPFALRSLAGIRSRLLGSRRALAVAASVVLTAGLAMLASIIWSWSHPEVLAAAGQWVTHQATQLLWLGVRGTFSNVVEQPWFALLSSAFASPARLAVVSAAGMLVYGAGLYTLRRLMAYPGAGVAHAHA